MRPQWITVDLETERTEKPWSSVPRDQLTEELLEIQKKQQIEIQSERAGVFVLRCPPAKMSAWD